MAARESVDTEGLIVVKHTIEPNPKADCVGHFPTHVVETAHEIQDGEGRQSVIDSMRKTAQSYRLGRTDAGDVIADELEAFADRVEQIDETAGELLARLGLDEGDRVEIRWPTVREEVQKLAKAIDAAMPPADDETMRAITPDPASMSDEAIAAQIASLESTSRDADTPEDDLTERGYARLFALQAERDQRNSPHPTPWPDYRDERTAPR